MALRSSINWPSKAGDDPEFVDATRLPTGTDGHVRLDEPLGGGYSLGDVDSVVRRSTP